MKFIFSKRHKKNEKKSITGNPFTADSAGRSEWNDRYFNMKKQISWWQVAFVALSAVTILLAITVLKYSTRSHIQPVVVEVCNGEPKGIVPVTDNLPDEDSLIRFEINQFILHTRTITSDADAQKRQLDQAYAYSSGNTLRFLNDYYHANNPFSLATQMTSQVVNINSIKISPHTWQVTWEEMRKNINGNELISHTKWVANIIYQKGNVNPTFINENPFGIYFSQITWSEVQTQKA